MSVTLTLVQSPTSPNWGLGPLVASEGIISLVRWPLDAVEGGMPQFVGCLIAEALALVGHCCFPTSESVESETKRTRLFRPASFSDRLRLRMAGLPSSLPVACTRDPTVITAMFDDGVFPWSMGNQFALLTRDGLPTGTRTEDLMNLFEPGWIESAINLTRDGGVAVIRAGTDGDVLGLFSPTKQVQSEITDALKQVCSRRGAALVEAAE